MARSREQLTDSNWGILPSADVTEVTTVPATALQVRLPEVSEDTPYALDIPGHGTVPVVVHPDNTYTLIPPEDFERDLMTHYGYEPAASAPDEMDLGTSYIKVSYERGKSFAFEGELPKSLAHQLAIGSAIAGNVDLGAPRASTTPGQPDRKELLAAQRDASGTYAYGEDDVSNSSGDPMSDPLHRPPKPERTPTNKGVKAAKIIAWLLVESTIGLSVESAAVNTLAILPLRLAKSTVNHIPFADSLAHFIPTGDQYALDGNLKHDGELMVGGLYFVPKQAVTVIDKYRG